MTAAALIAEFEALGIVLIPDPERGKIRYRPASAVPADLRERLLARKAEVLALLSPPAQLPLLPAPHHVAAYRAALREFWRLMAHGADVEPETAIRVRNEVFRYEDEVGEPRATELRHAWEAEWHRETGRCPRCGEPGEQHGEDGR